MTKTLATRRSHPPAPPPTRSPKRSMWLGIALGTLTVAWLTRGAWTTSLLNGGDNMFHLIRTDEGIELLRQGRIIGWSPRNYLGTDLFLFYGPGLAWATAVIKLASLGLLDNPAALTFTILVSLLAVPAAVAFLARSLNLSYRAAGIAAILSTLVTTIWGVGIRGVFETGLLTHQLATVLWILGLGCLIRVGRSSEPGWMLATVAFGAGIAITSPIVLAMLAAVGLCAVITIQIGERPGWALPGRVLLISILTAGLASFWFIPAFAHRDLRGTVTFWRGYEPFELLGHIAFGRLVLPPGAVVVAVVAAAFMVWKGHRSGWLLLLVPTTYLALEAWVQTQPPQDVVLAQFQNHRGLGLIGLLLMLPLAWAIDTMGQRVGLWRTDRHQGAVLTLIALGVTVSMLGWADSAKPHPDPIPQMYQAAEVLAELVPPGGRFAFARHADANTGTISPHHWMSRRSGVPLLNGAIMETTRANTGHGVGENIGRVPPQRTSRDLIRHGTTHIVTTSEEQVDHLMDSGLFEVVWEAHPIAILEVLPSESGDPTAGITADWLDSARRLHVTSERQTFEVTSSRATTLTVALAWSPRWSAELDGTPVDTYPNDVWMTSIDISAGTHTLDLRYHSDRWDRLGMAISTLTFLVSISLLWKWRRASRSNSARP